MSDDDTDDSGEDQTTGELVHTIGKELVSTASTEAKKTIKEVLGAYFENFAYKRLGFANVLSENANYRLPKKASEVLVTKAEEMEPSDVTRAPVELAAPIMDQLSITEDDDLTELLLALLISSGSKKRQNLVHPSMVVAAKSLSPDEAKILKWLGEKQVGGLPMISYYSLDPRPEKQREMVTRRRYFSAMDDEVPELQFPKNVELYAENMISLGIYDVQPGFYPEDKNGRNVPHKEYDRLAEVAKSIFLPHNTHAKFRGENYMCKVTTKGRMLINAVCDISIDNSAEVSPD